MGQTRRLGQINIRLILFITMYVTNTRIRQCNISYVNRLLENYFQPAATLAQPIIRSFFFFIRVEVIFTFRNTLHLQCQFSQSSKPFEFLQYVLWVGRIREFNLSGSLYLYLYTLNKHFQNGVYQKSWYKPKAEDSRAKVNRKCGLTIFDTRLRFRENRR